MQTQDVNQTQEENGQEEKVCRKKTFVEKYKKLQASWERGEKAVGNFFVRWQYPLLFFFISIIAVCVRIPFFDVKTGDYNSFLSVWFEHIKANGGFLALGKPIPKADYSPAYYYILAFLTYLPFEPVYLIKAVSCLFDIVLAVGATLCVWEITKNIKTSVIAYAVVSLLPTVFLNSGAWGQCDGIYVSFTVLALYFMLKKKHFTAMIMYGISFSFKLQAIFFAPVLAVLWFTRKIPRTSPLIIVGVYFLSCLPMWIMGRNLWDLLCVYFNQAGTYSNRLVLNAPSLLALVGDVESGWVEKLSPAFVVLTMSITVLVMYIYGHTKLDRQSFVDFGLLFTLAVPYLLPHMHERYFYLADIFAIVYVALHNKRWYTALLTQFCSYYAISLYLFKPEYLSLAIVAVIQGINLILLCKDLWKDYSARKNKPDLLGKGA